MTLAQVLALFGVEVPRRLETGAPACGNVMTKSSRPRECRVAEREEPRVAGTRDTP